MFNPQFSALSANSSIGKGNYHAMQWTIRKRFSGGLLFDLNYTWSKSIDLGSTTEGGSFTGFIINTFDPSQMRGVSSYDTTHSVNANFVYQLPFGRGRKFGNNMNKFLDAIVGGWEITGLYRQTSGLPFTVINGQRWPTNWNLGGNATPNGQPIPAVVSTGNATGIAGPNLWQDPAAAFAAFREDFAGESGGRTNLRGEGLFDIDSGVYKSFTMPWSEHQKLTFRWESYNLTNSVRFDPASGAGSGNSASSTLISSSFGKLTTTLGNRARCSSRCASVGSRRNRAVSRFRDARQIVRSQHQLATAYAGADADHVEQDGRLVEVERVRLSDADRRNAAAYVARERQHFLDGDQLDFLVAAGRRQSFQIEFRIGRNAGHQHAVAVAARHQRFEDLLRRHADLLGDTRCAEVVLVHFVFAQLVANGGGIQHARGVRLGHQVYCKELCAARCTEVAFTIAETVSPSCSANSPADCAVTSATSGKPQSSSTRANAPSGITARTRPPGDCARSTPDPTGA